MLFIGVVIVSIALVFVFVAWMRAARGVTATDLGWMSQQWLAEHRASHPR
jgi:hypothetical protein